jgi:hypothetical protein
MRSSVRRCHPGKRAAFVVVLSTIGLSSVAMAPMSLQRTDRDSDVVTVAEKCGAGFYRYGPDKQCHKFDTPAGSNRGTVIACPPGMHIGPEGVYCWPN